MKKKAQISGRGLGAAAIGVFITSLILLTVLFEVAADVIPEAQTAGDTLNATGVPLGGLVAGSGVTFTIVMAGLVLAVLGAFLVFGGRRR